MRLERREERGELVLELHGRLDAGACRHLEEALEEALRQGAHRVVLDMEDVPFLSSAGIRTLLLYEKNLRGLGGGLSLRRPSPFVQEILGMVGLTALFAPDAEAPAPEEPKTREGWSRFDLEGWGFGTDLPGPGSVRSFGPGTWGLGVGAFEGAPGSFGEILGAEGFALFQPPGEGGAPDFMAASGDFVPSVRFASGLVLRGEPSVCLRFAEPLPGLPLSRLAREALEAVKGPAALALLAETSGLVGASLTALPGEENPGASWEDAAARLGGEAFFAFPDLRDHLDFRPEKRFDRHLALVVGVAVLGDPGSLRAQVRRLGEDPDLWGHFHGAVFPFKAIPQGRVDLRAELSRLLDALAPVGVLHLLHDRRPISGAGESAFLSGALWAGPLAGPERSGS